MLQLLNLVPAIGKILNRIIPDPNEAKRIEAELTKEMMNSESELYKAAGSIITAEAKGESWMQRNWRPITMLAFVFIIANNYILAPYVQFIATLFGSGITLPTLSIPDGMWGLLQIGIGGYITSRGVEKVTKSVQTGGTPLIGGKKKDAVTREDLKEDREALIQELRNAGNDR